MKTQNTTVNITSYIEDDQHNFQINRIYLYQFKIICYMFQNQPIIKLFFLSPWPSSSSAWLSYFETKSLLEILSVPALWIKVFVFPQTSNDFYRIQILVWNKLLSIFFDILHGLSPLKLDISKESSTHLFGQFCDAPLSTCFSGRALNS